MKITIEKALENAENYLKRGVNIESNGYLHLDDWNGNSGHPKWVKNKLIPSLQKQLVKYERLKEKRNDKKKDKKLTERKM